MTKYTLWVETFSGQDSTDAGIHAVREYKSDKEAKKGLMPLAEKLLAGSTRVDCKIYREGKAEPIHCKSLVPNLPKNWMEFGEF